MGHESIWDIIKKMHDYEDRFNEALQERFGEQAIGCIHHHFEVPQVGVQLQEKIGWIDYELSSGNPRFVSPKKEFLIESSDVSMTLEVINEVFYKGGTDGNDDN